MVAWSGPQGLAMIGLMSEISTAANNAAVAPAPESDCVQHAYASISMAPEIKLVGRSTCCTRND